VKCVKDVHPSVQFWYKISQVVSLHSIPPSKVPHISVSIIHNVYLYKHLLVENFIETNYKMLTTECLFHLFLLAKLFFHTVLRSVVLMKVILIREGTYFIQKRIVRIMK
jgi:hypothetical protein